MGAVAFLLVAVVISAVGLSVLYVRNRPPTSFDASVDSFRRQMRALAPRDDDGDMDPGGGSAEGS